MRRVGPLIVVLVVALAGCEGEPTVAPSPRPSPSPRTSPPAWASPIEDDVPASALPDERLVPPGAQLGDRVTMPAGGGVPEQVAVAYAIGSDPFGAEHGLAVWQRFAQVPAWSVVFTFTDAPARQVLGIDLQSGDLTGDGHDDLLTFEQTGGSGGCGRWRVIATTGGETRQVFSRSTCDAEITIADGSLELREAVFEPGDAHCCPSAFRFTTLEWNGTAFAPMSVRESPGPSR